ncbi:hypothetical protein [Streptomyces sp. DH37]|uniref:hypothetical protein n=1 Tax=Streptomyces sp. DH37 TaxID=3040122 RepID=UPI002442FE38|nr:hypothetical protein [Streptomyces sp. DH37]MDG9706247.1 hypothetical protein [Streptomyces sp. DH37]
MSVSLPQEAPVPPEAEAGERAAGTAGAPGPPGPPGLVVLGDGDAPGCADGVCAL